MGVLVSNAATYEFSLEDMKKLIMSDLGIDNPDAVRIEYRISNVSLHPMDRDTSPQVTGVKVIIDNTKLTK